MRVSATCLVVSLAVAGVAKADTFTYACKDRGKSSVLVVDDTRHELSWREKTYKTRVLDQEGCPRYGWHAERQGQSFDLCTATRGYADFVDNGSRVQCNQVAVPEEYLGNWSLASEANRTCDKKQGPAEVTGDNIQTYHEDFCKITDIKAIATLPDPRLEISCVAGGEGGPEKPQHETWRMRNLLGKHLFIEQTPGGLTFWERCSSKDIGSSR